MTRSGRANGPRPLREAIATLRRRSAPPTLLAKVQDCWADAVGPAVASHAAPTSERDGVVTVTCRSAVWSAELTMLSSSLAAQLNEALPEGSRLRGLRFSTGPSGTAGDRPVPAN